MALVAPVAASEIKGPRRVWTADRPSSAIHEPTATPGGGRRGSKLSQEEDDHVASRPASAQQTTALPRHRQKEAAVLQARRQMQRERKERLVELRPTCQVEPLLSRPLLPSRPGTATVHNGASCLDKGIAMARALAAAAAASANSFQEDFGPVFSRHDVLAQGGPLEVEVMEDVISTPEPETPPPVHDGVASINGVVVVDRMHRGIVRREVMKQKFEFISKQVELEMQDRNHPMFHRSRTKGSVNGAGESGETDARGVASQHRASSRQSSHHSHHGRGGFTSRPRSRGNSSSSVTTAYLMGHKADRDRGSFAADGQGSGGYPAAAWQSSSSTGALRPSSQAGTRLPPSQTLPASGPTWERNDRRPKRCASAARLGERARRQQTALTSKEPPPCFSSSFVGNESSCSAASSSSSSSASASTSTFAGACYSNATTAEGGHAEGLVKSNPAREGGTVEGDPKMTASEARIRKVMGDMVPERAVLPPAVMLSRSMSASLGGACAVKELEAIHSGYYEGNDCLMLEDILHDSNPALFPLQTGTGKLFRVDHLAPCCSY
eukprot:CAMPEP_0206526278 /NCGR_PEP_ID=MMETSP0325_2-20121206/626_1 /ASSEMBLY_ACC=CAM_ASM_000347 /TAXON_ID=2866 /ORGANISM="Crypthecodinium cohnii, Strain Seligo" /LENGTH=552 /DNA_ID=CAMNT_0054021403 /DNA_START=37 /DNA_END=1695 /DNA_ORIENTATION=+